MPIAIESEHVELAKSVKSLLEKVAPPEVLHAALEAPVVNPPVYWKGACEQGLQGLHLSEAVDGQGAGLLELAVVIAEFGLFLGAHFTVDIANCLFCAIVTDTGCELITRAVPVHGDEIEALMRG